MNSQTIKFVVSAMLLTLLLLACGCQQRNLAPELNYSASDVETIRNEINAIDWQ